MDKAAFMDVLKSNANDLTTTSSAFVQGELPEKKVKGALKTYAKEADAEDILLLLDDTLFGTGKKGIVMTSDVIYLSSLINNDFYIPYKKIGHVEVGKDGFYKKLDKNETYSNEQLYFFDKDDEEIFAYDTSLVNKGPLKEILDAALKYLV